MLFTRSGSPLGDHRSRLGGPCNIPIILFTLCECPPERLPCLVEYLKATQQLPRAYPRFTSYLYKVYETIPPLVTSWYTIWAKVIVMVATYCRVVTLGLTDAIAVSYNKEVWITQRKIWKDVQSNYETVVGYDANHLQKELYKCNLQECGTVLEYINKIRELPDKLVIRGNTPRYTQMTFHLFEGLPKTPEWKTWIMVTKSVLSSQMTIIGYT